jgi:N-acyl homoserine lactone hydrolase
MSTYVICPLQTARTTRPMHFMTYLRNFGRDVEMFYGAFLIKGADRNILVDTGCDAASYAAGPMPSIEDGRSIEENLGRFGLRARDIDAVILTHLHFDHVAFLHLFGHCPKFVQKRELRAALNPHPYFSNMYVATFFKDIKFELIDGDINLFPGIETALVPGHSHGAQAVIVETEEGRAVISGFCCVAENFAGGNTAIPGIHEDLQQAYESMHKLLRIADIIYPNHSANPAKIKA